MSDKNPFDLIEMCGDDFGKLERVEGAKGPQWYAYRSNAVGRHIDGSDVFTRGSTPSEAVARLRIMIKQQKALKSRKIIII